MIIWIDAQLSPAIAGWIRDEFSIVAVPIRDLGMRDADDREIVLQARLQSAVVMTKDSDFVVLQAELGPPPKLIWLTCGNTSNLKLRGLLKQTLREAIELLNVGEDLVEIS